MLCIRNSYFLEICKCVCVYGKTVPIQESFWSRTVSFTNLAPMNKYESCTQTQKILKKLRETSSLLKDFYYTVTLEPNYITGKIS